MSTCRHGHTPKSGVSPNEYACPHQHTLPPAVRSSHWGTEKLTKLMWITLATSGNCLALPHTKETALAQGHAAKNRTRPGTWSPSSKITAHVHIEPVPCPLRSGGNKWQKCAPQNTRNSQPVTAGPWCSPVGLSWSCASPSSLCPLWRVPLSPYAHRLTAPGQERRFAFLHPNTGTADSEHCSNTGGGGRRSMSEDLKKGNCRPHLLPGLPHHLGVGIIVEASLRIIVVARCLIILVGGDVRNSWEMVRGRSNPSLLC